ncbi:467_t:CDS:2, partial [Funneliformis geosporum]
DIRDKVKNIQNLEKKLTNLERELELVADEAKPKIHEEIKKVQEKLAEEQKKIAHSRPKFDIIVHEDTTAKNTKLTAKIILSYLKYMTEQKEKAANKETLITRIANATSHEPKLVEKILRQIKNARKKPGLRLNLNEKQLEAHLNELMKY